MFLVRREPTRAIRFVAATFALACAIHAGRLHAHHPGAGSATRALPGGRALRPAGQVGLVSEYRKGERGNRHSALVTGVAEIPLADEVLGLTFEVPYVYFAQKNRADAGRYGRARTGLRLSAPLEKLSPGLANYLLVLDGDVGFPTARNRNVYLDEPYADARAGLSAGYASEDWFCVLRGGGVFPASRLPSTGVAELVYPPWQPEPELIRDETHELKKTTEWQGRLGIGLGAGAFAYVGGLHRRPYAGVVRERAYPGQPQIARTLAARALETDPPDYEIDAIDLFAARPPSVYREAEVGLIWNASERWTFLLAYRYPFYRKREVSAGETLLYLLNDRLPPDDREFRLYDEVYDLAITYSF